MADSQEGAAFLAVLQNAAELIRETQHYAWEKEQRETLTRIAQELDSLTASVRKLSRHTVRKEGTSGRRAALALARAIRSFLRANRAFDLATWGAADLPACMEMTRAFAWHATFQIGEASAWMEAAQPRARSASRGQQLMDLAASNRELSVAKLNAMLSVPLDDATARRYVRRVRGG